ncbi:MAG: L-methionine (R)-S-oxide reductase [Glaciecola sp.]|jgi:L-methionine (R)-S-oxide reductase
MIDKSKQYKLINSQVRAIISEESDMIANMANIAAVLYNHLENVNWSGFYLYKESQLVLGPFQGQPACIRIPMGKGACGTSAELQKTLLIDDVHQFDGHITCDVASRSEIVVPIVVRGRLIGVLDVDSPIANRFDQNDKQGLEELVDIFSKRLSLDEVLK